MSNVKKASKISKIALALQASIIKGFKTREEFCVQRVEQGYKEQGQIDLFRAHAKTVESAQFATYIDQVKGVIAIDGFAKILPTTNKQEKSNFVACYATTKIVRIIAALAQRDIDGINKVDPYTASILANALINSNKLSADGQTRSLSKRVDIQTNEVFKSCANVCLGTANTQKSSTGELARILGLDSTRIKGARHQTLNIDESKIEMLRVLFKLETEKEESAEESAEEMQTV